MSTQTHHWLKYVLIALLALCLFFFYGNSHADERFASYDIAGKPQTADTTATNTDPNKDTTTTATNTDSPSDLTANDAIINPSNVLNAGEIQYFNRRLDNLYKQHQVQTQLLIINKKDGQALADAQQFVKQWQTKETRHRIAQDMFYYTDSQYYFDGIDWALDSVVKLLEDGSLGLSYEQISDKAEYHFGQLLGFVLVWTLVAIVAILVINRKQTSWRWQQLWRWRWRFWRWLATLGNFQTFRNNLCKKYPTLAQKV